MAGKSCGMSIVDYVREGSSEGEELSIWNEVVERGVGRCFGL